MRVLFMLHPEFPPEDLAWIGEYECALKARGVTVDRFEPRTHKVRDWDVVQVFSRQEGEMWKVLHESGPRVIVTPGISAAPKASQPSWKKSLFPKPALLHFADFYFAPISWHPILENEWKVPAQKLRPLEASPAQAAEGFLTFAK